MSQIRQTLSGAVSDLVVANPQISNAAIFDAVRPLFPNDNPEWLRNSVLRYKCVTLRKLKAKTAP
jgi:hypothetical protein